MTTAQLKLTAALPEGARATAKRVASRFHLDQVGWFQSAEDARLLPALADAAWNDKRVELRYRRWNDSVTRKVQPLTANENACALISMVARSKCSNQRPDTLIN
jgi:predicted DNA-binding transcriptional regulator YafY